MKLNFDFDTKDLNGNVLKGGKANEVLSKILVSKNNEFDLLKAYDMAMTIRKEREIEIDRSDLDVLKKIIKEDPEFIPLVRAQIISSIQDQEKQKIISSIQDQEKQNVK